jgi:glycosyltransferase 2 family protein
VTIRVLNAGWVRAVLAAASLAAAVLAFWWRGPRWDVVADSFESVYWRWALFAVFLNLLSVLVRAVSWRAIINQAMPPPHPRFRDVFSAFGVGLLGNAVLPARAGEVLRVSVLHRRLPPRRGLWATLAGTVFAHRVFDLVAVALLVLYVMMQARIPAWAVTSLVIVVALGAVLLGIAFMAARRHTIHVGRELGRIREYVVMARNGLGVLRAPLASGTAILAQCAGWFLQLTAVWAAMHAFRIEEPFAAAGLVLLLMNVATIFPLWPGNVGLLQAAVALPLVPYGITYAHGFAFGIGLQAIEMSVGVGVGLVFLAREGITFAALRRISEEDEAEAEADKMPPRAEGRTRARARVPG